ncbi:MAG: SoxR reducing system RseC family protein [Thiotrichales bacterium]
MTTYLGSEPKTGAAIPPSPDLLPEREVDDGLFLNGKRLGTRAPSLAEQQPFQSNLHSRRTVEKRVRIQHAAPGVVWVEPSNEGGCAACGVQSRCGVSALGRLFSRRRAPIALATQLTVRAGDEVVLELSENGLLHAALLAYVVPATLALGAATVASLLSGDDRVAALAAVLGIGAGLGIARIFSRASFIKLRAGLDSTTHGETS